jgi:chemotaxis protein MotA
MVVIGGCIFVVAAVLTGFMMAGGHIEALIHPSELVTIGGASLGAMIIMSPKKVMMDLIKSVIGLIKGSPFSREMYVQLFGLLYSIARTIRRDGALALESIISDPHHSPVFQKYPKVHGNHHVSEFICSALALLVDGKADSSKLSAALEEEVKVIDREHHAAVAVLSKTADALPGFGIVAAVLGIVVTMGAIDGPASEIGHKVGAALVGTFLGILMSYGFFAPMAGRMELLGEMESIFFRSISAAVVSINNGDNPRDVINNARRVVGTEFRPSATQMTEIMKDAGNG